MTPRNDGHMDWRQARPGEHILPHYPAQEWPADTAAYKRGYSRGIKAGYAWGTVITTLCAFGLWFAMGVHP